MKSYRADIVTYTDIERQMGHGEWTQIPEMPDKGSPYRSLKGYNPPIPIDKPIGVAIGIGLGLILARKLSTRNMLLLGAVGGLIGWFLSEGKPSQEEPA